MFLLLAFHAPLDSTAHLDHTLHKHAHWVHTVLEDRLQLCLALLGVIVLIQHQLLHVKLVSSVLLDRQQHKYAHLEPIVLLGHLLPYHALPKATV